MAQIGLPLGLVLGILLAGPATAADAPGLAGAWDVTWLSNDSHNPLRLEAAKTGFDGTYVNDAGDACAVTASYKASRRRAELRVACPNWDILMQGTLSADGDTVTGKYVAYGNATGDFRMERHPGN
jgi:hypothetical protein